MKRHDVWLSLGDVDTVGCPLIQIGGLVPGRSLHQFVNLRNWQVIHPERESAKSDPA